MSENLESIYISPLESCNLNCQLCYTQKTKTTLKNEQIVNFINRYKKIIDLKSVLFCGGEVFILPNFPELINELSRMRIFITITTNGTINRLDEITDPQNCQLLVSFDGPEEIHDKNRGKGNFYKSIAFIKNAIALGFPTEIMFLITQESYNYRDTLPQSINSLINNSVNFNYITQKTCFFNSRLKESGLTPGQIINIKKNYPSIPDKNFGCFQLSLQSNGLIYGCCESPTPIAKITDPVEKIVEKFEKTLAACQKCGQCSGCCNPEFLCGYAKELGVKNCQEVVKLLGNNETV
jgi:organic radical activating enzyme